MNKTLKLFSLVAGFATLGSQINVYACDLSGNEEIVRYRTSTYCDLIQESPEIVVEEKFREDMNYLYNRYFRDNRNKLKNPYVIIHWFLNQMFPEAKTWPVAEEVVNKCLSFYLKTQVQGS